MVGRTLRTCVRPVIAAMDLGGRVYAMPLVFQVSLPEIQTAPCARTARRSPRRCVLLAGITEMEVLWIVATKDRSTAGRW
jgi:hypothetical protein